MHEFNLHPQEVFFNKLKIEIDQNKYQKWKANRIALKGDMDKPKLLKF